MTTAFKSAYPASMQAVSTLQQLVGCLMTSFLPAAERNNNHFVNDIPDDVWIDADRELVASVLSGMIAAVVKNAKESCIRLSAKIYGNVILVHVKDYNSVNYYPVENGLQQLQPLAERVGGSVGVTSQRDNVTTFAFSFPNLPFIMAA
jgi:hypothetical protein